MCVWVRLGVGCGCAYGCARGWVTRFSVVSVLGVCAAYQDNHQARMCDSHSWFVCCHPIVQFNKTSLMYAAVSKSEHSPALVEILLNGKAEVNAASMVSVCEGDGAGCHMYGVASGWNMTV